MTGKHDSWFLLQIVTFMRSMQMRDHGLRVPNDGRSAGAGTRTRHVFTLLLFPLGSASSPPAVYSEQKQVPGPWKRFSLQIFWHLSAPRKRAAFFVSTYDWHDDCLPQACVTVLMPRTQQNRISEKQLRGDETDHAITMQQAQVVIIASAGTRTPDRHQGCSLIVWLPLTPFSRSKITVDHIWSFMPSHIYLY